MNKREWLVSKGLAKANARGRFNLEATAALKKAVEEGIIFDEAEAVVKLKKNRAGENSHPHVEVELEPPVRNLGEEIIGYTRGDFIFAFSSCRACGKNINYCKCSHILAPAIIEYLPENSPAIVVRKR